MVAGSHPEARRLSAAQHVQSREGGASGKPPRSGSVKGRARVTGGDNRWRGGASGPWWARLVVAVAVGAALTGCGDGGGDDPAPVATAEGSALGVASPAAPVAGTPAAAGSSTGLDAAGLGAVVWATAVDPGTKAPLAPVTRFAPDAPALYAALPVARVAAGATLTAAWTYNRTPIEGVAGTVTAAAAAERTWVEFHLTLAAGETWPEGTYGIAVAVDGQAAQTAEIGVGSAP